MKRILSNHFYQYSNNSGKRMFNSQENMPISVFPLDHAMHTSPSAEKYLQAKLFQTMRFLARSVKAIQSRT